MRCVPMNFVREHSACHLAKHRMVDSCWLQSKPLKTLVSDNPLYQ